MRRGRKLTKEEVIKILGEEIGRNAKIFIELENETENLDEETINKLKEIIKKSLANSKY